MVVEERCFSAAAEMEAPTKEANPRAYALFEELDRNKNGVLVSARRSGGG